MGSADPQDFFPFDSFRQYQWGALQKGLEALGDGQNVLFDLPTGVGKSPINTSLCRWAESSYYTTPQQELRLQLKEDSVLNEYFHVLEARGDYTCGQTGDQCDECEFYTDPNRSCNNADLDCTYMGEITNTLRADNTVLTMSRLLIAAQKEFEAFLDPRHLLVVDEVQNLADQTASMHANIQLGPGTDIPNRVYEPILDDITTPNVDDDEDTDENVLTQDDFWEEIQEIQRRLGGFVDENEGVAGFETHVMACKRRMKDFEYMYKEIANDRDWVVDFYTLDDELGIELKPVRVDRFLRRYFWSMGKQYVLSTATVPYRGEEERWLSQLGLNPDNFEVISYPSPFPADNRTVHTNTEVGQMSQEEDNIWGDAMEELNTIAGKHSGQKGLIHTASYDRAERIKEFSSTYRNLYDNVMIDERGTSRVEEWQNSDKDILCSPSLTEGVDLEGDRCRWQVLFKVPYPHPSDARVRKMLQDDRWYWYMQKAATSILQSVGRAVRGPDDTADFYVVDSSFEQVRQRVTFPEWFEESIQWTPI